MRVVFILQVLALLQSPETTFCQKQSSNSTISPKIIRRVSYFDDGRISQVAYYQLVTSKLSAEEAFLTWGKNPIDSTSHEEQPFGEWTSYLRNGNIDKRTRFDEKGFLLEDTYQYLSNGAPIIKRRRRGGLPDKWVIGNKDSVELSRITFNLVERAHEPFEISTNIRNLSANDIEVSHLTNSALRTVSSSTFIKKGDSTDVKLKLTIPEGQTIAQLMLHTTEWAIYLELVSYGYHLTTNDFLSPNQMVLPRKFIYLKTGDEYQLETMENGSTIHNTIPTSRQATKIEMKRGKYTITLVSQSGRLRKEIVVY